MVNEVGDDQIRERALRNLRRDAVAHRLADSHRAAARVRLRRARDGLPELRREDFAEVVFHARVVARGHVREGDRLQIVAAHRARRIRRAQTGADREWAEKVAADLAQRSPTWFFSRSRASWPP